MAVSHLLHVLFNTGVSSSFWVVAVFALLLPGQIDPMQLYAQQAEPIYEGAGTFAVQRFINEDALVVQNWTIDDGLPVNGISDIGQDQLGYIWLTTYDGVVRFDGHRFQVFNTTTTPDIGVNRFAHIFRDDTGNAMWFTTDFGGLVRYKSGRFTRFAQEQGLAATHVLKPFDWDGRLIVPARNGLFEFQEEYDTFVKLVLDAAYEDVIQDNLFHAQMLPGKGVYLIVGNAPYQLTPDLKLHRLTYNGEQITSYKTQLSGKALIVHSEDRVYRLAEGTALERFEMANIPVHAEIGIVSDGERYFISTTAGVHIFSDAGLTGSADSEQVFHPFDFSSIGVLREFLSERNESLYFATLRGFVVSYRDGTFSLVRLPVENNRPYVSGALTDDRQNMWIITSTNGLLLVDQAKVHSISKYHGLLTNSTIGIFEDAGQHLWVNTRGGGLVEFKADGSVQELELFTDGRTIDIYAFAQISDGTLYVAVNRNGIAAIRTGEAVRFLDLPVDWRRLELRSMLADSDDSIWIGAWGGLYKMINEELVSFTHQEAFDGLLIQHLAFDEDGGLWVATAQGGVFYLRGEEIRNYTTADGLGINAVRGIYADRYEPGTVWFATEGGGLSRYRQGRLQTLTVAQGLHHNLLHNITEDFYGRLWMSTNNGIFSINKDEAAAVMEGRTNWVSSRVFRETEGMLNAEGNGGFQNSFLLRTDGLLMFATQGGVAVFETGRIQRREEQPRLVIEELVLFSATKTDERERIFRFPEFVDLKPGNNDFSIRYTAVAFRSAPGIRFQYMLVGYDQNWIDAGFRRVATYTNLPPGNYTFRVRLGGSNGYDPAASNMASLRITIAPAYYETSWFYGFIALLISLMIYGGHRYRVRHLLRQEAILTSKVEARTTELEQEKEAALGQKAIIAEQADQLQQLNAVKDKFFSVIAHDLKGPYSGINGLIEMLHENAEELSETQQKEVIRMLAGASENFSKLLENLLTWARIQMKQARPEIQPLDAAEAISSTIAVFDLLLGRKNIRISYDHPTEPLWINADANMLSTILRNLIGNAVKFSFEHSEIKIRLTPEDGYCCISIQDHGTGISEAQIQKLFQLETTFSYKGTANESGTGVGLILCKDMTEAMGGTISLSSKEGEGTTFTIRFPLAPEGKPEIAL